MRPPVVLRSVVACAVVAAGLAVAPAGAQTAGFGSSERLDGAFRGRIYAVPEGMEGLPDSFDGQDVLGEVYAEQLDIPLRDFTEGFPGYPDLQEWFAVEYEATVRTEQAGTYTFRLESDDGSRLFIDGALVVDNDGLHEMASAEGSVDLAAGEHAMRVQFYQGWPTELGLRLFVRPPGGDEAVFPGPAFALTTPEAPGVSPWWALLLAVPPLAYVARRRLRPAPSAPPASVPEMRVSWASPPEVAVARPPEVVGEQPIPAAGVDLRPAAPSEPALAVTDGPALPLGGVDFQITAGDGRADVRDAPLPRHDP